VTVFDLEGAARQARTGNILPGWQLLPLKASQAWTNAILGPILAVGMIAFSIGNLIHGLTANEVWAPDIVFAIFGDNNVLGILIGETVVFFIAGIAFGVLAVRSMGPILHRADYFLLITPDGFIEAQGAKVQGAAFADVTGMNLGNNAVAGIAVRGRRDALQVWVNKYGKAQELFAELYGRAQVVTRG
jgi:hypothetical protein